MTGDTKGHFTAKGHRPEAQRALRKTGDLSTGVGARRAVPDRKI
jgi:hypothetical protein